MLNIHINISGGTIQKNGRDGAFILNKGIAKVNVFGDVNIQERNIFISNNSTGMINIYGGTITAGTLIENTNAGNIEISDGTMTVGTLIRNTNIGNIDVYGGTIEADTLIRNTNTGNVDIKNVEITLTTYGVVNNSNGIVNIKDVIIKGNIIPNGNIIQNTSGGTINIEDTDISVEGDRFSAIYNTRSAGIINIKGDTNIYVKGTDIKCIYEQSGVLNIENAQITAEGNNAVAIYSSENNGTISLKEGRVEAKGTESYAVNITGGMTFVMGDENKEFTNGLNPVVIGEEYGISNSTNGIIKIYDGQIIAGEGKTILGPISEIRDGYIINLNVEDGIETAKLGNENTVTNITTGVGYKSLKEAIDELGDNEEAELRLEQSRIFVTNKDNEKITIKEGQNVIVDLNGKIVEENISGWINNNGTLTIKGTDGIIQGYKTSIISNNSTGKLYLNGGNLTVYSNSSCAISNNDGEVIINNGSINGSGSSSNAINNYGNGKVEMNGGTITALNYGIYNYTNGSVIITGGTLSTKYSTIRNGEGGNYTGTIEIDGQENDILIKSTDTDGIYNYSNGSVTIKGENANIEAGTYGIENESNGSIDLQGGKITGGRTGIWNKSNGVLTMTGGEIVCTNTSSGEAGIYNSSSGTLNIISGNIKSSCNGIYNRNAAKIIIGSKDGIVDNKLVSIDGNIYGLYINNINAEIYFYDGIIKGNTSAINNKEKIKCEDGYEVEISEDGKTATLGLENVEQEGIVSIEGGAYYNKIEKAVRAIDEGTILIHKIIELEDTLVIPSGKNIIIDLRQNAIKLDNGLKPVIKVEEGATLRIIDSLEDGNQIGYARIENTQGVAIENNGTLIIGVQDETEYANSPRIIGTGSAITGSGIVTKYDGTIVNN